MRTAGELLSTFFDKNLAEKAQGYSDLFSCWTEITEKNGIPSVAAHSRIIELERAVLLVETDHPGWIQILQIKQSQLLKSVVRRFPDLEIRGISFRLSRNPPLIFDSALVPGSAASKSSGHKSESSKTEVQPENSSKAAISKPEPSESAGKVARFFDTVPEQDGSRDYFNRIEDKDFLETLKRLEKLERRGRFRKKD